MSTNFQGCLQQDEALGRLKIELGTIFLGFSMKINGKFFAVLLALGVCQLHALSTPRTTKAKRIRAQERESKKYAGWTRGNLKNLHQKKAAIAAQQAEVLEWHSRNPKASAAEVRARKNARDREMARLQSEAAVLHESEADADPKYKNVHLDSAKELRQQASARLSGVAARGE